MLFATLMTSAYAQYEIKSYGGKPKAGDRIQGVIRDSVGPISAAVIKEINFKNKNVEWAIADKDGHFTLKLVNPADSFEVFSQGYYTIQFPISESQYDILLQRNPVTFKDRRGSTVHDRTGFKYDDIHPLIYLDGITFNPAKTDWEGLDYTKDSYNETEIAHLLGIEADSITKIKVLRGEAATKMWGTRARNGYIEVWTKGHDAW